MPLTKWWGRAREIPGAPRTRGLGVTIEEWRPCAGDVAASGGRLLAMWASPLGQHVSDTRSDRGSSGDT
ncbi:MAG TPA: hypothetical protein VHE11_01470, partial [Steroidobacteraceae bacterium]|nr:hypothetical protein [Steroidobacteraceae bacterium]